MGADFIVHTAGKKEFILKMPFVYSDLPPKHLSITSANGDPLFAHLQPDVVFPIQQNTVQTGRTEPLPDGGH